MADAVPMDTRDGHAVGVAVGQFLFDELGGCMSTILQIVQCYWLAFASGAIFGFVAGVALTMTKDYEIAEEA